MSPKQKASIRQANRRLNLWDGAVRSGKTYSSLIAWLDWLENDAPAGEFLMVGKTERTLKRNILDPITEMLDEDEFRLVSGSGECFIFGRRAYLAGANDERSEGKIRGLTLVGSYGDELSLWPESFFTMLLSRLSVPGARLFGTTNPDSPGHWLKKNYIDREQILNLSRFHFQMRDNPALTEDYITEISQEFTGLWYRRYILGEWCVAEGAIYDMFDPSRHVYRDLPSNVIIRSYYVGIDYGTVNPFVALLMGVGNDNRLYILSEWRWDSSVRGRQMTDSEYSVNLTRWLRRHNVTPWRIFYDPSAASFGAQLYADGVMGAWTAEDDKVDNDVLDGIRNVSTLLAHDRLVIQESCTDLIEEMQGYAWDAKKQERGEDAPIKQADHSVDALRYVVHNTQNVWLHWVAAHRVDWQNAA